MATGIYDPETGVVAVDLMGEQRNVPAPVEYGGERNLIFASPECGEIFGALADAQGAMENPKKTKTAKVKGRTKSGAEYDYSYAYAPLDEIMNVIRKPLADVGLVHRQFLSQRGGIWTMRTIVAHRSGQWYGCDYPIFWDEARGMQGFASGVTYARRYGLMMALGLVGEDDDDANVADGSMAQIAPTARSAVRTAQEAPRGGQSYPARPQAAPAPSDARAEAQKRYKEIMAAIDAALTIPAPQGLDGIDGNPAWAGMEKVVRDVEDAAKANQLIEQLRRRIADRRDAIEARAKEEVY